MPVALCTNSASICSLPCASADPSGTAAVIRAAAATKSRRVVIDRFSFERSCRGVSTVTRASLYDLVDELLGIRVVLSLGDQALAEERLELLELRHGGGLAGRQARRGCRWTGRLRRRSRSGGRGGGRGSGGGLPFLVSARFPHRHPHGGHPPPPEDVDEQRRLLERAREFALEDLDGIGEGVAVQFGVRQYDDDAADLFRAEDGQRRIGGTGGKVVGSLGPATNEV